MTKRLRLAVFKSLLKQDGAFYDQHAVGKLAARLASDAPNVQAVRFSHALQHLPLHDHRFEALDQRLADVLAGIVALAVGVSIAFYFDPIMAPVAISTAVLIVILQLFLTAFLKRRAARDVRLGEEASRVGGARVFDSILAGFCVFIDSGRVDRICSHCPSADAANAATRALLRCRRSTASSRRHSRLLSSLHNWHHGRVREPQLFHRLPRGHAARSRRSFDALPRLSVGYICAI